MSVLGNLTAALDQAQASVGEDAAMAVLRGALASTQPPGIALSRLDDAAVVELAAAALAAGTLQAGAAAAVPPMFRLVARPAASPAPAPAPASSAASAPRSAPAPAAAPSASTFPASLDAAAMAQALREAAADGVPFCEECAREAAEAAA